MCIKSSPWPCQYTASCPAWSRPLSFASGSWEGLGHPDYTGEEVDVGEVRKLRTLAHAAAHDKVRKALNNNNWKQHVLVKQNYWATRLSEFSHSPDTFCFSGTSTGVEIRWLSFFSVFLGLKHTWMFVYATLSLDTGRKHFLFKVQTNLTRIVQILLFTSWDTSWRLPWSTRNTFI